MTARLLIASLALVLLATSAHAADPGRGGEIVGTWTVTGDDLGKAHVTMEFSRDNQLTVTSEGKSNNGQSHSSTSGPTWKLQVDKLTFDGSTSVNGFDVKGNWALTWDGPDTVTAKTGAGKEYRLERVKEKK